MKSRVLVTLVKCCNDIENLELKQDIRPTEIILAIFGVELYTNSALEQKAKDYNILHSEHFLRISKEPHDTQFYCF